MKRFAMIAVAVAGFAMMAPEKPAQAHNYYYRGGGHYGSPYRGYHGSYYRPYRHHYYRPYRHHGYYRPYGYHRPYYGGYYGGRRYYNRGGFGIQTPSFGFYYNR